MPALFLGALIGLLVMAAVLLGGGGWLWALLAYATSGAGATLALACLAAQRHPIVPDPDEAATFAPLS